MRRLTQAWKLRRSFGSQPIGSVAGPRCPEAGLEALVISAKSPRWTFHEGQRPTCRPADLPTCRLGDLATWRLGDLATWRLGYLATWRWMTTGVSARALTSGHRLGASFSFNTNVEGFASSRVSRTRRAFPSPMNCPSDSSGVIARCRFLLVKPLSLIVARSQISPRDGYDSWELFVNKCL